MFFSLLLYGIIDWIFKNITVRNGGGGVRWVRVRTQWGHSKRTYAYNGGEVKFLAFGAYVLNE